MRQLRCMLAPLLSESGGYRRAQNGALLLHVLGDDVEVVPAGQDMHLRVPPVPVQVVRVAVGLIEPLPRLAPTREDPRRAVDERWTDLDVVPRGDLGVEVQLGVDCGS